MTEVAADSGLSMSDRQRTFRRTFLLRTCGGLCLAAFSSVLVLFAARPELELLVCSGIVTLSCLGGFALAWTGETERAAQVLLFGLSTCAILGAYWFADNTMIVGAIEALLVAVVLAPFLLSARALAALIVVDAAGIALAHGLAAAVRGIPFEDVAPAATVTPVLLVFLAVAIRGFVAHARENQELLGARLRDIADVVTQARRIADGDLSGSLQGEGAVQDVISSMVDGLRGLVQGIQGGTERLASATSEIAAMAAQQERSTVEQSAAIEETGRTIESLLSSSRDIAQSAQAVAQNAEATHKNAETISERLAGLSAETERITEILDMIKEVSTKSEFLALNAALEGAKAGEAGRGFSLVAAQMQRLAESVMESVQGVKALTSSIQDATRSTVLAAEDATKLARDTTDAARRIRAVTQQQQSSTEQVTQAMGDIAETTQQTTAGTTQTLQAVRELSLIADSLRDAAQRFRL
ncbi:MAG: methyl-accepting chemotaxis protein [Sandaracinaceae bacterium]|nr:methyl-accepting chemotaxis protein [Sandaracinaceae bacterium]